MRAPEFWYPQAGQRPPHLAGLLVPAACLYAWIGRARQRRTIPAPAGLPVICIGNLTAGGTGKTPVALAVAAALAARGRKPVFLTRGFGGREPGPLRVDPARHDAQEVGDEPLLLARACPTIVAHDRIAGAREARYLDADVIVMDDGFQNPTLKKDLSLIVVDVAVGFGNGHVIPAGPLREPIREGLARADAVILLGDGPRPLLDGFQGVVLAARLQPDAAMAENLRGQCVSAFAGIGRPEKFFDTLRILGATLVHTRGFPDHYVYQERDITALKAAAAGHPLVTTQKDLVRLPTRLRDGIIALPVRAAFEAPDALDALIDRALSAVAAAGPDQASR